MSSNGKSKHISLTLQELPQATKCSHCDRTFALAVPILGQQAGTEYVQLAGQCGQHLVDAHPKIARAFVQQQMQLSMDGSALMVLANYSSTDAGLLKWRDEIRYRIHNAFRKNTISDETISEKAKLLGLTDEETAEVIVLLKEMRDVLEERDPFNPMAIPAQSIVLAQPKPS